MPIPITIDDSGIGNCRNVRIYDQVQGAKHPSELESLLRTMPLKLCLVAHSLTLSQSKHFAFSFGGLSPLKCRGLRPPGTQWGRCIAQSATIPSNTNMCAWPRRLRPYSVDKWAHHPTLFVKSIASLRKGR